MPKISAIVTCYNLETYIATALQSLVDSGVDDMEIIIVDDMSTDKSRYVIDAFARLTDVPITRMYFEQNTVGGVGSAANAGLNAANGDVIIFLDGDDWVFPQNLAMAIGQHLDSMPDFTFCNCKEYANDTGSYHRYPEHNHWRDLGGNSTLDEKRRSLLRMAPFPWRKIYSRRFLDRRDLRFPVGDFFFEDNTFHWETTLAASTIELFQQDTHVHRLMRTGQSISGKNPSFIKIFEHARLIRECLVQHGCYDKYLCLYIEWVLKHVVWCAGRVPPGYLNQVYNAGRAYVTDLPEGVFNRVLEEANFSISDVRKATALYYNDRMSFLSVFEDPE